MKPPKPSEIMAAGITNASHNNFIKRMCAKEKAEKRSVNSASVLNHEAACLFEACMAKLRDGAIEYESRSCTIRVNMPSNTALHVTNGWIDYDYRNELKTRLAHHFAVENIEMNYLTVDDVGCGSMYRSTQTTGECRFHCCCTSLICCGIPLLAYWLPMAAYRCIAGESAQHTCAYSVNLSLKK